MEGSHPVDAFNLGADGPLRTAYAKEKENENKSHSRERQVQVYRCNWNDVVEEKIGVRTE